MAELIDKEELIQIIDTASDDLSERLKAVFIDIVEELPTTTEAEIRASVIDEFAKEIEAEYDNDACPNVTDYLDYKISLRDLFRIAEQLKEE